MGTDQSVNKTWISSLFILALVLILGAWTWVGQTDLPTCDCDFPGEGIYGVQGTAQGEQTCIVKPCVLISPDGVQKTFNK